MQMPEHSLHATVVVIDVGGLINATFSTLVWMSSLAGFTDPTTGTQLNYRHKHRPTRWLTQFNRGMQLWMQLQQQNIRVEVAASERDDSFCRASNCVSTTTIVSTCDLRTGLHIITAHTVTFPRTDVDDNRQSITHIRNAVDNVQAEW